LNSKYNKEICYITVCHENSGVFKALFEYIDDYTFKYTNEYGKSVIFNFLKDEPSQFADLV